MATLANATSSSVMEDSTTASRNPSPSLPAENATSFEEQNTPSQSVMNQPPGTSEDNGCSGGSSVNSTEAPGSSLEASTKCEPVVTTAMVKEEEQLAEDQSIETNGEVEDLRNMVEQQRYNRLMHLLKRSTVYSSFLVKRMESQIELDKKKQEKEAKKKSKASVSSSTTGRVTRSNTEGKSPTADKQESAAPKKKGRGRKRKASQEAFRISDYMDSEGKLKKLKTESSGREEPIAMEVEPSNVSQEDSSEEPQIYFEGKPLPERQPRLLTGGIMRSYQLDGMDWIKCLYENGVNGILGDEMGLGKTIQCISVIAYMLGRGVSGPFLVAAPLSTVPNWVSEFKRFTPRIPVVLYHGTALEREQLRKTLFMTHSQIKALSERGKKKKPGRRGLTQAELELNPYNPDVLQDVQPVVVTSYEICMRDQKFLQFKQWSFMVVDEGHRIKNLNCKLIKALKSYDAGNRLLLSGTPLQNNLSELWSLLNFLLPDIFDDLNSFQSWFDFDKAGADEVRERIIAQEREQHVLRTLHQILTPFLLRRLKTDVEYSLPPKREVLVFAPLTTHQEKYYKSLLDKSILHKLEAERKARERAEAGIEEEEENSVEGRKARKAKKPTDYSQLTDEQFDSIMTGEAAVDDFLSHDTDETTQVAKKAPTSAITIKMTGVFTMLRLCCNHPYLLEFPLTADGNFRIDEDIIQCCGKTRVLDRLLKPLITQGHKVLVFSQFTKMLDIIEECLDLRGIQYSRLDGSMKFTDRQTNIERFKSDPKCSVFLLSTRAAGLGLNLTEADTVIIYDSDWNPQSDLQAQDRCHRIGQSKPVMIYRLVTSNTIDQRIVERAATKRKLEKMVIHKGKFKGDENDIELSLEDLGDLLKTVDHDKVVNSNGEVISDKDLAALLDRSSFDSPPDQGASDEGAGSETSHSGVFKVLEDIGNVVSSNEDTKQPLNEVITSDENEALGKPHSLPVHPPSDQSQ